MKFLRISIAALCLGALTPRAALAGYDEGLAAAQTGDYALALAEWRPLAETGDTRAQYELGRLFYFGLGTSRDFTAARNWFAEAVRLGDNPDAEYILGQIFYFGHGTNKDYAAAHSWFLQAAKKNHAPAQHDLGIMYLQGQGRPRDPFQAYVWFNRSAAQGFPNASRLREKAASLLPPERVLAAKGLGKSDPRASFRDGKDYLSLGITDQGYFVQGMADMLWEIQMALPENQQFAWTKTCLRSSSAGDLTTMYSSYLQQHTEEQQFAAAETFLLMMEQTCKAIPQDIAVPSPTPPAAEAATEATESFDPPK